MQNFAIARWAEIQDGAKAVKTIFFLLRTNLVPITLDSREVGWSPLATGVKNS